MVWDHVEYPGLLLGDAVSTETTVEAVPPVLKKTKSLVKAYGKRFRGPSEAAESGGPLHRRDVRLIKNAR